LSWKLFHVSVDPNILQDSIDIEPGNIQHFRSEQPSSHLTLELPIGFADLCLSGDISSPVITIIRWIPRFESLQNKRNGWLNVPGWTEEDPDPRDMKTIDMLLLQGLLAFCLQSGFDVPPSYQVSYETIKTRLTSIAEAELASIAEKRCMRDALVWIYLSAAGAFHNRAHRTEENRSHSALPSHVVLLKPIFRLFDNPKSLWWCNMGRTLNRFWLPERLTMSWKQCWNDSLGHCQ
jgi:hypothetical protein